MSTPFDFDFKLEHLVKILHNNPSSELWYNELISVLPEYDISNVNRVAAFLAQTAHESGGYKFIKENLNYKAESLLKVFPKYFKSLEEAKQFANDQSKIANRIYGSRMGNGNESSGDGYRYCGRGLIQLTGKNNYQLFANSIGMPLEQVTNFLETYKGAVQSACWYWNSRNLNSLADAGDTLAITKKINGGTIGLEDRIKHYNHAVETLTN